MARIKRFQIDTDHQIARALLRPGTESERQIMARARLVGIFYRREYAKSAGSRANSPFEQKDQLSITDPGAFHVNNLGDHIEISVESPAAEYAEIGNTAVNGKEMFLQVKPSKVRKKKGSRGGSSFTLDSGAIVRRSSLGKFYIRTEARKSFHGYHLLEKAVRLAFGIR